MKIVGLVGETPDGTAFASCIHNAFSVDLTIVARPRLARDLLPRKYRTSGLGGVADATRERVSARVGAAARHIRRLERVAAPSRGPLPIVDLGA